MSRLGRARKGQALAEFALVLPIFMMLLGGLVDLGYMYQQYLSLQNAAREGARLGAVGASVTAITTRISNILGGRWNDGTLVVTVEETDQVTWREIRVIVTAPVRPVTPIVAMIPALANGVNGRAVAAFRKE